MSVGSVGTYYVGTEQHGRAVVGSVTAVYLDVAVVVPFFACVCKHPVGRHPNLEPTTWKSPDFPSGQVLRPQGPRLQADGS